MATQRISGSRFLKKKTKIQQLPISPRQDALEFSPEFFRLIRTATLGVLLQEAKRGETKEGRRFLLPPARSSPSTRSNVSYTDGRLSEASNFSEANSIRVTHTS